MVFKKDKGEFLEFSKVVKNLLDKGNYDGAVARYTKLERLYNELPIVKRKKYDLEYNSVVNQLLIYLKIEELNKLVKENDLGLMEESLNYINYMINSTDNISKNYLKFVDSKYHEFLRVFNFKLSLEELYEKVREIYRLRSEEHFDLALEMFPDLMVRYEELENYSSNTKKIYNKLIDLRESLKMGILESRAHDPAAQVDLKMLKESLRKKNPETARSIYKRIFRQL